MKRNQLGIAIKLIMAASIGTIAQSALAVEALDDHSMSNVTGEGVALILDDFKMRFNGADDGAGTGYSYVIPVGPLSDIISAHNAATACVNNAPTCTAAQKSRAKYDIKIGKADLYLYGLAISKNDNDLTTQFSDQGVNVGTADNPWLFLAKTVTTPNFKGDDDQLTYLGFEAPLLTGLAASNFDLKLGVWADAFVRDPSQTEFTDEAQTQINTAAFHLNGATRPLSPTDNTPVNRENRLRLQAIMNGVGINGTNLKIFQTLNGAESAAGLGTNYNYYNNTLGLAMTTRINSGDGNTLKANYTAGTVTRYTDIDTGSQGPTGTWTATGCTSNNAATCNSRMDNDRPNSKKIATPGYTNRYTTTDLRTPTTGTAPYRMESRYRLRTQDTVDVVQGGTWTAPTDLDSHAMRLSTREKSDSPSANELLHTPAINNVQMPKFADNEGLFLYNPNINLVIGTQWQPVVMGVAEDGKNLSLELTRIPNSPKVYKEIYTDYSGVDSSYKGGTCSIYWCGGAGNGISQNATHSSISIGSTETVAATATKPLQLNAFKGNATQDAVGVSFGALPTGTTTAASRTDYYYQLQAQYRTRQSDSQWSYSTQLPQEVTANTGGLGGWTLGTGTCRGVNWGANSTCYQFNSVLGNNWGNIKSFDIPCISNTSVVSGSGCSSGFTNTGGPSQTGVSNPNNLGYAPNVVHPTYTAGVGWSNPDNSNGTYHPGVNINQHQTGGNSSSDNNTSDPRNGGLRQDWTVNKWGGMHYSGRDPSITANSPEEIRQNILNAYGANYVGTKWTSNLAPDINTVKALSSPMNNLGSAVIDGLLIQHMKLTTKGL